MAANFAFLVLLLSGLWPASITACTYVDLTITKAAKAAKALETSAFDINQVRDHFKQKEYVTYAKNTDTTFSCVDARAEGLHLGTPGGDLAELSNGIYTFFNKIGIKPNASSIDFIFRQFMSEVATPQRPFYFHTDEAKLKKLSAAAAAQAGRRSMNAKSSPALPTIQPSNHQEADVWYNLLVKPEYQGCGHLRLMMSKHKSYGLDSPFVTEQLIKSFVKYWWPTPLGSKERSKIIFSVKPGPLAGRAVAIINNSGPACTDSTPLTSPSLGGSSLFVYHQQAVADFRKKVLAPFFKDIAADEGYWGAKLTLDKAGFTKQLNQLANKQLGFTLGNLPPANSVNMFAVNYRTEQS